MEAKAIFEIDGALCEVVPEDTMQAVLGESAKPYEMEENMRVIGRCLLYGQRYVIICGPETAEGTDGDCGAVSFGCASLLTRREREVALMVSEGLCNKQIAGRLGLSEWTVSSYLRRCFAKLQVHSRTAMVTRLLDDVRLRKPAREGEKIISDAATGHTHSIAGSLTSSNQQD